VYLAVWLLTDSRSLIFHPEIPQLNQVSMDPNFYTWALAWWPYAISHGLSPLHPTLLGAPHGYDLTWIASIPTIALAAWPLTVSAGAIVSFNVLTAIALPVSAWAAFVVCRRLTGRFLPSMAGGVIFGFSAYQADHNTAGQLNLTFSLLLPLMAYLIVRWWQGRLNRWAFAGLLALGLVLQFYLFLETFADLVGVSALALLAGYALAGRANRATVLRLAKFVGLAYLLALIFIGPYLAYALTHVPRGFQRSPTVGSLDLSGLVLQRPDSTVAWFFKYAFHPATRASLGGYVGIPLLVLAVALLVFGFRRRVVPFLFVMLVLVIAVSLGPVLTINNKAIATLPWHRLWFLPVARSAYPVRFMVFAYLALAIMVAIWLAGPWPRFRRIWVRWPLFLLRWLVALLAITAVVTDLPALQPHPTPSPAFIAADKYQLYLRRGETVIVQSDRRGNAGMLWQAETDFYYTLAGGYINAALAHYHLAVPLPLSQVKRLDVTCPHYGTPGALSCAAGRVRTLQRFLNRARVKAIILERGGPFWLTWLHQFHNIGIHGRKVGGVWLYEPGPRGWRLHAPRVYKRNRPPHRSTSPPHPSRSRRAVRLFPVAPRAPLTR
jgi:hypothetical protein